MQKNTMLIVGDIHLKHKNIQRSKAILNSIENAMKEYKPNLGTVLLGDIFDTHSIVHLSCLSLYCDFLENTSSCEKVHVLGNHEASNSVEVLNQINVLMPFKSHKDTVDMGYYGERPVYLPVTEPMIIPYRQIGRNIGFIPYIPPKTEFHNILKDLETNKPLITFCHQEFEGFAVAPTKKSTIGDPIPDRSIISGHLHRQQTFGKVWYPGSPAQSDFGDDENKFIFLIEVGEEFELGYQILETITLGGVPKFKTVKIQASEVSSFVPDLSDDHYRFVIEGSKSELQSIRIIEQYENLAKLGKIKLNVTKSESEAVREVSKKNFMEMFKELAIKEGNGDVYQDLFE